MSAADNDRPLFVPDGAIIFRASEGGANFVYRMKEDRTGRQKIVPAPILFIHAVSPDGRWVLAHAPVSDADVTAAAMAYPTGGAAVRVCNTCGASWSRDGRRWYLQVPWNEGRTYVIALPEANGLPELPAGGIRSEKDGRALGTPGIEKPGVAPGGDADVYAFEQTTVQRNLHRIPLPP
jgi:hypothetical protein